MSKLHFIQLSRILSVASFSVLLIVGLIFFSFSCTGKIRMKNTKSSELYFKWEFYNNEKMEIVKFEDSIQIIERNGVLLYRIAYPYEKTKAQIDSAGDLKKETLLSDGINYKYFFHKIGKQTGIMYDSLNSVSYQVLNANAFLKSKISFDSEMFYNSNDSLLFLSKKNDLVIETYVPKVKADDSFPDTSILSYSDKLLKGLSYSLAPKLDSTKKMKLNKVIFIYNKKSGDVNSSNKIPRREYVFEIKETKEKISESIERLFDKAENIINTKGKEFD